MSFRLWALLTLALLPIGIISIYQTQQVITESEKLRSAALLYETTTAISEERAAIRQMVGVARGLSAVNSLSLTQSCQSYMDELLRRNPSLLYARFVDADGARVCFSGIEADIYSDAERVGAALVSETTRVELLPAGITQSDDVIIIDEPFTNAEGARALVTLAFPVASIRSDLEQGGFSDDLSLMAIDGEGSIITSTTADARAADLLPRSIPPAEITRQPYGTFHDVARNGEKRMFALVPIVGDQLVALGTWPVSASSGTIAPFGKYIALAFPVLMWIASIVVSYFGLQQQVIRHIRELRSAMRQFALGTRTKEGLKLDHPPSELRELERAFNRMALILSEAEAQQKRDLEDKEILLREVHHRVKNNLQLIASIMNMQARVVSDPSARKLVTELQRRVNGLSMLYRTLYTKPDLTRVDARELVLEVISEVSRGKNDSPIDVDSTLDSVTLLPDQAVPLSMFLSEALNNAIAYYGAPDGTEPYIRVNLREHIDGKVALIVENSRDPGSQDAKAANANGLGIRLMSAFVRQLNGEQIVEEDDTRRSVSLIFAHDSAAPQAG